MKPAAWKKNTGIFITSQAITLFGSSLVQYAITWHITLTTNSGAHMTLAIICGFLPTFLLSPFAGVWADRYGRKLLIILADSAIAFVTLLVAVCFIFGFNPLWLLYAVLTLRALGTAVQTPAIRAMLPDLAPEASLTRVNGINHTVESFLTLVSPMLGALLLNFFSIKLIFFIDVATAAIAVPIMALFFHTKETPRSKDSQDKTSLKYRTYFEDFKQGLAYITQTKYLRSFFAFSIVFYFLMAPMAFLPPLQVARTFEGTEWQLAIAETAFSVGLLGGGLAISVWGGMKNRVHTMLLASFLMAGCVIIIGLPLPFAAYLLFVAFFGVGNTFFNTSSVVLLQEKVDSGYIGRVMGVLSMISSSALPLGMVVFGPLADVVSVESILILTGVCILILAILLARSKALLQAGVPAEAPLVGAVSRPETGPE